MKMLNPRFCCEHLGDVVWFVAHYYCSTYMSVTPCVYSNGTCVSNLAHKLRYMSHPKFGNAVYTYSNLTGTP